MKNLTIILIFFIKNKILLSIIIKNMVLWLIYFKIKSFNYLIK